MKSIILGLTLALLVSFVCCVDQESVNVVYKEDLTLDCSSFGEGVEYRRSVVNNGTEEDVKVAEKEDKFKYDDNKLVLKNIKGEEIRSKFSCFKDNKVVREFKFNVAPRLFKPEKTSQTVTEGGFVELKCTLLFGNEDNQDVTWEWTRNDTVLATGEQYDIKSSSNQTALTIKKAVADDKGDYSCKATNAFGSHDEKIQIRVKDALAALWPFLAIVAEVILLCLIILIYEKRCAKKPASEEENEQAANLMGREQHGDLKKRGGK